MLTEKIKALRVVEPAIADCWDLTCQGIEYEMLRDADVPRLVNSLRLRQDLILDEIGFEFLGAELRVRFRDEECLCDPVAFMHALEAAIGEQH